MHTRFAPSPTGPMHLGHVAAMIHVWGLAQRSGAAVSVRIEDHDAQRCRPEFIDHLKRDLDWLGFVPTAGGRWSRQSEHVERFEEALKQLRDAGLIYACRCSRKSLAVEPGSEEPCYSGTCRDLGIREGSQTSLRVRLPDEIVRFHDAVRGVQEQRPARQCGDLVVRDRHCQWSYQFAVVVDDWREAVDWVVRGDDLLASTGRQLLLARLLGRRDPVRFFHHRLIIDAQGKKLSKSDAAAPLAEHRDKGRTPADVIGLAAFRVGLQAEPHPLSAEECGSLFSDFSKDDVGEEFRFVEAPGYARA